MAEPYKQDVDQLVAALTQIAEGGWGVHSKNVALEALTSQRQREVCRAARAGASVNWAGRP